MNKTLIAGLAAIALAGCSQNYETKDASPVAGTQAQEYDSGWQKEENGWGWYKEKRVESDKTKLTLSYNLLDENGKLIIEHQWNIYFNPDGTCERESNDGSLIGSDGISDLGTNPRVDIGCDGDLDIVMTAPWTPQKNTKSLNNYKGWIEGACKLDLQKMKEEWRTRAAAEGNHSYDTGTTQVHFAGDLYADLRVQSNDTQLTVNCDSWEWRAYAAQDGSCERELFIHKSQLELPSGPLDSQHFALDEGCDGNAEDASFTGNTWNNAQEDFLRKKQMFDEEFDFEAQLEARCERGY